MERNYARHRSYGNAFIALRGHYLTAGFYYLIEYARLDDVRLYSGSLRFGRRQYDFVTVRGGGFRTVVMSVVMLMAGAFVRIFRIPVGIPSAAYDFFVRILLHRCQSL